MKSGKNGKAIKSLRISSSKQTNLIIEHGFSWTSPVRRTAVLDPTRIQLGRSPSWINRGFSSAVRRAGPKTDSARPFVELDQSSSANGRAGPNTYSARLFAELDQSSLVNGRAGSNRICLHLVLITPLPRLHRTHSCFVSIEGIVRTLRFKNRKNPFFLEENSD
ncbi:hypothetical protein F2Q69_00029960 [Brassica cretica]|uniref:Uncharacterized protein n=1 Tax=Brassica cretica TaxID=69181 RepID=A0A8S9S9Y6_BRACR|nr:hypothetical protein F2Q69_00029960 [Brassica cretica]